MSTVSFFFRDLVVAELEDGLITSCSLSRRAGRAPTMILFLTRIRNFHFDVSTSWREDHKLRIMS